MPTTITRTRSSNFVLGVNGCRGGWVFVRLSLDDSARVHLTDGARDARGLKMEIWG